MFITICEDEPIIAQKIAQFIKQRFPTLSIQLFSTGKATLEGMESSIYLLDIELQDMNGLELAKQIRNKQQAEIIFITAHEKYVFEAFDVEPLHYLLKPVHEQKLETVLHRALDKVHNKPGKPTFTVQIGPETLIIEENELLFAEAQGRQIVLHLQEQTITYYGRISSLEEQLSGPFFRSHRSYLVHFKYITRYDQSIITLTNNELAYIARNRYKDFVTAFSSYLEGEF